MAKKDHQPTIENLKEFIQTREVSFASHYGSGINRVLSVTLRGYFKVYKDDTCLLTTRTPQKALDAYNNLYPDTKK